MATEVALPDHPPIALTLERVDAGILNTESKLIRRRLGGRADWAAVHDHHGPWLEDKERVTLFGSHGQPVRKAAPKTKYEEAWLHDLASSALRLRFSLNQHGVCATMRASLVMLMPQAIIIVHDKQRGKTPLGDYYLPAPDVSGHDLLDAQAQLDRLLPGRFHILD